MRTESLRVEHRRIEAHLDAIAAALLRFDAGSVAELRRHVEEAFRLASEHIRREEEGFYSLARKDFPELSAKMEQQHSSVQELGQAVLEMLDGFEAAPSAERLTELRRYAKIFQSFLQHHLLEEERDVFSLADNRRL